MSTADHEESLTLRARARIFVERPAVTNGILGVIIFNAVTLRPRTAHTLNAPTVGLHSVPDRR